MPHFEDESKLFLYLNKLSSISKYKSVPVPTISLNPQFQVGLKTDFKNINSFCSENNITKNICKTDYFWLKKAELDFNYPIDKLNSTTDLSAKHKYEILSQGNLEKSVHKNRPKEVEVLLGSNKVDPRNNDNNAIRIAIENNYSEIVKLLLEDGRADPNYHDSSIRWAASKGYTEVIRLILEDGRVNPVDDDNYPLNIAAEFGRIEVVKLYLKDGRADPGNGDNFALTKAAEKGHVEVVKLLLKDPRVKPDENNGALQLASRHGYIEVVKVLLQDPRVVNNPSFKNALKYSIEGASEGGYKELARLLRKYRR